MECNKICNFIKDDKLEIEHIMSDYTNYIYKVINNYSPNLLQEDIEEITLDVFLTLWKNKEKLDITSKMSSYIAGITKNLIKLKYRQIKILDNIEDYEDKIIDLANLDFVLSNDEKFRIISEELNKMKKEDKSIFISYYNDEIKIKELAEIYNMSENKIKSKLFRIRKKLNKKLKERGYGNNE